MQKHFLKYRKIFTNIACPPLILIFNNLELTAKYLPSASIFYEVKDADTEEVIIPFGTGSKISCDSTGNFFNLWLDGFQAERNYRFCVKVVSGSGTTETINYYDDDYEFRVVR